MKLLNIEGVAEKVGLSKSTIKRLVAAGGFPLPARLSERRVVWLETEVEKWLKTLPKKECSIEKQGRGTTEANRTEGNEAGTVGPGSGHDIAR